MKYQKDLDYFDNKKRVPVVFLTLVIIRFVIYTFDINIAPCFSNLLSMLGIASSLIFWYSCFTKNINGGMQKLLSRYSPYNFTVYLFHGFLLGFCQKLCLKVLPHTTGVLLLMFLFIPIVTIVVVIFAGYLMKRIIPKTYAVITGGRIPK